LDRRHSTIHAIHCILADEIDPGLHLVEINSVSCQVERNAIAISLARKRDQISLVLLKSIATDFRTRFTNIVEASIVASKLKETPPLDCPRRFPSSKTEAGRWSGARVSDLRAVLTAESTPQE